MIFPEFSNGNIIDDIRRKYDPLVNHVRPHITLVFPFDSSIQQSDLKEHIVKVLSEVKTFEVSLKGITPSRFFGNYLFLNIEDGKEKIINIHNRLYTDLLKPFLPAWLVNGRFNPHMTVGKIESEEEYRVAIEEVSCINDVFRTRVDKISVEIIDKNEDSIIEIEVSLQ